MVFVIVIIVDDAIVAFVVVDIVVDNDEFGVVIVVDIVVAVSRDIVYLVSLGFDIHIYSCGGVMQVEC